MSSPTQSALKGARLALLVGGVAAVGFGIAVLTWPTKAAVALAGVVAVYAVIAGIVSAVLGVVSQELGAGVRIGHVLLGLLYITAGILAFSSLHQSAAFLALFLTIMVGVMWMIEGFTTLLSLASDGPKSLTIVFAALSIIAGFTLLSSPLWGAVFLWWFLGVSMVVLGALNVIRAITGKQV